MLKSEGTLKPDLPTFVIPRLVPGIHVDRRGQPDHDD